MVFPFLKSKKKEQQKAAPPSTVDAEGERSSNPQVFIKLAEHFLRENKSELAVDEYLNAATAFLEKRQTQLAMAVYRNIITIDPERYSVYETLADLYRMAGFHGDGASVLLALAYQYKTAGCDSEVKRVLNSVLEFSPDNPVLKRKVQAFYAKQDSAQSDVPVAQSSSDRPRQASAPLTSPAHTQDTPAHQSAAPSQASVPQPVDAAAQKNNSVPECVPDATAKSFFDLQEALSADESLGIDCDPSSEDLVNADPESSPFSVLNVVKNIALQDPQQDTPLFHFNLGIAYMQCGEYGQAVDELLSALYGIPDKIGCYIRLSECSLKLQRRELACGFLREALSLPNITPNQAGDVKKRLDEISAG